MGVGSFELCGQESHSVCSFRIDDDSGMPVWVSEVGTGAAKPCNLSVVEQ